jgi:hypothetical protein
MRTPEEGTMIKMRKIAYKILPGAAVFVGLLMFYHG